MRRVLAGLAGVAALAVLPVVTPAHADPSISPSSVESVVFPGESISVNKTVGTPVLPPKLDVCLLEDETSSYADDITNLKLAASDIYDNVVAVAPNSQFAVAGFRDYPPDAYVYRLVSTMNPTKAAWVAGVMGLTASGGGDIPEAQFDAIVLAAVGDATHPSCGWRTGDPDVTRVLLVATDAPFHVPPAPYINTSGTTTATLNGQNIIVIGLKAPGAGSELNVLAANTGGTVQNLSSNGAGIAAAIVTGLSNLPIDVSLSSNCAAPISTTFAPTTDTVTSGSDAHFVETISVAANAAAGTYHCSDSVSYDGVAADPPLVETKTIHVPGITLAPPTATNELTAGASHTVTATVAAGDFGPVAGVRVEFVIASGPNAGLTGVGTTDANGEATFTWSPGAIDPAHLGTDVVVATFTDDDDTVAYGSATASKTWRDTTPPKSACVATTNPAGKNVPKAPGNGGQGQNQDGFYELTGSDEVSPTASLQVFVTDTGTGTTFGPFAVGTKIKYTEANGATPSSTAMGGPNSAVQWHIKGQGDASIKVVDGAGNSSTAACLVPPKPK